MKVLPAAPPAARDDRPSTQLQHDEANARVVAFHLQPGQTVPAHRSDSTVVIQVITGNGTFRGADGEAHLGPGATMVFAPGEDHAIEANGESLHFLAVITPRPGG
jgi:quercetin dioxygenase-like cupin family protein